MNELRGIHGGRGGGSARDFLQLLQARTTIVTVFGDQLLHNVIGHFGELLFHLMKQLHNGDVGACTGIHLLDAAVVVLIKLRLIN